MPRFAPLLLSFALALAAPMRAADTVANETGRLHTELFTSADFGELNRTLGLAQDDAGILYAGNYNVVVAFDGQTWRSIRTGGELVNALAHGPDDRIWVAGASEFGWLADDGRGGRTFHSLRGALPPGELDFGNLYGVEVRPHGVYFWAGGAIVRWHDGRATVIGGRHGLPQQQSSGLLFAVDERKGNLLAFDGANWRDFATLRPARPPRLTSIVQVDDRTWLIATARDGLWRRVGDRLERFPTDIDTLLTKETGDYEINRLRDGTLAISLWSGGVAFLDPAGHLLHLLTADAAGRPLPRPRGLMQDRAGSVWVALGTGVLRVDWPAAFTLFDSANGLPRAPIKALRRFGGRLYAGSRQGLHVLEPAGPAPDGSMRPAHFAPVPGCEEQIWDFEPFGDFLLLLGPSVRLFKPGEPLVRIPTPVFATSALVPPGETERALIGTSRGLVWLRRLDGAWRLDPFPAPFTAFADRLELADDALWIGSTGAGYYRLPHFSAVLRGDVPGPVEHFSGGSGFASRELGGFAKIARIDRTVWFADGDAIYAFDAAARRFVPRFHLPASPGEPAPTAMELGASDDGLWIQARLPETRRSAGTGRHFLWREETGIRALPGTIFKLTGSAQAFFEEETPSGRIVWLGGEEGIVRAQLSAAQLPPASFRVKLRRILDQDGAPQSLAADSSRRMPAQHATLTVEFSTDRLDDPATRFQTKLDGRDSGWSPWMRSASFTAAGLRSGNYVLNIRARDSDGRLTEPSRLAFAVLPRWWQSWWAILACVLAGAVAVAAFVRWRLRAIRRRNEELEALIATRTRELRDAKATAESANRAKSAFLANMSHELRTPLNAMLGFSQILGRAPDLSDEHRRRLAVIGRNGDHLLQLINEVLDLSKIEAGKLGLAPRATALLPLLRGVAETYAARAGEKGLGFADVFDGDLPARIEVDDAKLRQVLHNLLGNALKFTARGRIELRVERISGAQAMTSAGERLRFTVADTGVGIAPESLPKVFEAFYQTGDHKLATQGTGLGLTISQRIVTLMGGRIEAESAPGQGSRFHFTIDVPVLSPDAPVPALSGRIVGYAGPRRRLLLVDDEATNRDVLRGMLEPLGFALDECADGVSVPAAVQRATFDAILLDLRLGAGPDGYATARAIRSLPQGRGLAIIAISASVFEEDRHTALEAGCDAFVPKPFPEERLLNTLRDCLGLEWITSAESDAPTALPPAAALPGEDLSALAELAQRGDFDAFRERLRAIASARPECAATVHQLDEFAANFQLGRLRQALRQAGAPVDNTPSPA